MVLPSSFIEEFRCTFRIVRQRLDVGIEISRAGIEERHADLAQAQTDPIDDLLPIHEHRHGLANSFVSEERPLIVPHDGGFGRNGIFHFRKLLLERRTAGLFRILNGQKPRHRIHVAGL